MKDNFQKTLYGHIYEQPENTEPLPDWKITAGNKISGLMILAIGSGNARDIWHLAKENSITAVDNTPSVAGLLKKKGIAYKQMNLENRLPFTDHTFDLVIAKDILEHLTNPRDICREIRRVLKPGGYAVINVPNHFCLPMRLRYLTGKNLIWKTPGVDHTGLFKEWNYIHLRFFTWDGFREMLEESGLIITRTFFDLFTLSHYTDPEMVKIYFSRNEKSRIINSALDALNFIFPRSVRSRIAGIDPNLLSGSFYVWAKPL